MTEWDRVGEPLMAPAVARNRDAILAVLRRVLPRKGLVLEVASGTGEHALHFAKALPSLAWQPSDRDPAALGSIAAHRLQAVARKAGLPNLLPPVWLDARAPDWPIAQAEAIVCINMIHIAPWVATEGLMVGAGRILPDGGGLCLYGPFKVEDTVAVPSNVAFDASLRARDPNWGLRDVTAVAAEAARHGLRLAERVAMPANNLSLIFRKAE